MSTYFLLNVSDAPSPIIKSSTLLIFAWSMEHLLANLFQLISKNLIRKCNTKQLFLIYSQ